MVSSEFFQFALPLLNFLHQIFQFRTIVLEGDSLKLEMKFEVLGDGLPEFLFEFLPVSVSIMQGLRELIGNQFPLSHAEKRFRGPGSEVFPDKKVFSHQVPGVVPEFLLGLLILLMRGLGQSVEELGNMLFEKAGDLGVCSPVEMLVFLFTVIVPKGGKIEEEGEEEGRDGLG